MKSTGGKLMSRRANWEHTWSLGLGVQTYGGFLKRPIFDTYNFVRHFVQREALSRVFFFSNH